MRKFLCNYRASNVCMYGHMHSCYVSQFVAGLARCIIAFVLLKYVYTNETYVTLVLDVVFSIFGFFHLFSTFLTISLLVTR